mgnify:CR=1 FL=1
MTDCCGNCRFFDWEGGSLEGVGKCRRRAPHPLSWSFMQSVELIAGASVNEADQTGLLPDAVRDFRKGAVCDTGGDLFEYVVWPTVLDEHWCG